MRVTRQQIRDIYREIKIAPEEELRAMDQEEELFPAQAVVYIRSVNDVTSRTEGILRLVSGRTHGKYYFNNRLGYRNAGFQNSLLPVQHKYKDTPFGERLQQVARNSFEMGRVVFAEGVNEFRVLIDLGVMVASLTHVDDDPGAMLVAEAVPQARHRYATLGLEELHSGAPLKQGRILMGGKTTVLYDKYLGGVRRATAAFCQARYDDTTAKLAARADLDRHIARFSHSSAMARLYTYGLYQRSLLAYNMMDYEVMLATARQLIRFNRWAPEFRLLFLAAEVGSRYNFHTQVGDPKAALKFLDSPEAADLSTASFYPGLLDFYRGLVLLNSGDWAGAREARQRIDALAHPPNGQCASSQVAGQQAVETYRRNIFNPETYSPLHSEGVDRGSILYTLNHILSTEHPEAISSHYQIYRAEVFTAFGMHAKAARYRAMGEALGD